MNSDILYQELVKLLDERRVSCDEDALREHSTDKWHASAMPQVVVYPDGSEDVSSIMKFASANDVPVTTRGTGTGHIGGCVPVNGGISLSLKHLDQIIEISPEDGVAVCQPGVITGKLQETVRSHGWYYPPDPASLKECCIGGNAATNAGGPRCLKYGVTKQYILGLEIVLANGDILRTGGRCHKNKQGFDLGALFIGSEGMLGVITEVIVRLIPHPKGRAMIGAAFSDFPQAVSAVQSILNSGLLPSALEVTDSFTMAAARDYLGSEKMPPGNAYLMVEIDGQPETVERELKKLEAYVKELGSLRVDVAANEEACEAIWQLRRDFSYSLKATGLRKLNQDVVVPRSKLVELVEFAHSLQEETGLAIACFGHAGDGNIHTNVMVGDWEDPEVRELAEKTLDRLFSWLIKEGGAVTGEHGVGLAKKRWLAEALGEVSMQTHRSLKHALDPKNLLNPGKFLD